MDAIESQAAKPPNVDAQGRKHEHESRTFEPDCPVCQTAFAEAGKEIPVADDETKEEWFEPTKAQYAAATEAARLLREAAHVFGGCLPKHCHEWLSSMRDLLGDFAEKFEAAGKGDCKWPK